MTHDAVIEKILVPFSAHITRTISNVLWNTEAQCISALSFLTSPRCQLFFWEMDLFRRTVEHTYSNRADAVEWAVDQVPAMSSQWRHVLFEFLSEPLSQWLEVLVCGQSDIKAGFLQW